MPQGRPGRQALALTGALSLALAVPACALAEDRADNQDLVLRLVFEDCLGFVRDGTRPFEGLAQAPLRPEVEASLPAAALALADRRQLLSDRYFTYWGETGTDRLCVISAADDSADFPPILTVRHEGFIDRVSALAAAQGLTDRETPERFDMYGTPKWSEPGDDPDELRIVIIPYEPTIDGTPIDMGIIVVAMGKDRQGG